MHSGTITQLFLCLRLKIALIWRHYVYVEWIILNSLYFIYIKHPYTSGPKVNGQVLILAIVSNNNTCFQMLDIHFLSLAAKTQIYIMNISCWFSPFSFMFHHSNIGLPWKSVHLELICPQNTFRVFFYLWIITWPFCWSLAVAWHEHIFVPHTESQQIETVENAKYFRDFVSFLVIFIYLFKSRVLGNFNIHQCKLYSIPIVTKL